MRQLWLFSSYFVLLMICLSLEIFLDSTEANKHFKYWVLKNENGRNLNNLNMNYINKYEIFHIKYELY